MATTTKQLTNDPIVLRILGLIKKEGKKEKDLSTHFGISSGGISKWKYDRSVVYLKYIEVKCEYLNTTPNYLFLGSDDEDRLSLMEKSMLNAFRVLDEDRS